MESFVKQQNYFTENLLGPIFDFGEMSKEKNSNICKPTGILRRAPSMGRGHSMVRGGMLGKTGNDDVSHIGSPTSRAGVHFAVPENLSELLSSAASRRENNIPNTSSVMELPLAVRQSKDARV